MTAVAGDMLHKRVRNAFEDVCAAHGTIARIERAFEEEGFDPICEADGSRRGSFGRYADGIDWADPSQVARALQVFETMLAWVSESYHADTRTSLVKLLGRDGYTVSNEGSIRPQGLLRAVELPLEDLREPRAILEHFDRMAEAADRDPSLAISAAKALIEATLKTVLVELGEPLDDKAKMPALVRQANRVLGLDAGAVAPTAKGVEIVQRILNNLAQVATGLAELRNLYGTDHGRAAPVVGLGPRHAHLAVGAASTYCRMLLATLRDRREPP